MTLRRTNKTLVDGLTSLGIMAVALIAGSSLVWGCGGKETASASGSLAVASAENTGASGTQAMKTGLAPNDKSVSRLADGTQRMSKVEIRNSAQIVRNNAMGLNTNPKLKMRAHGGQRFTTSRSQAVMPIRTAPAAVKSGPAASR